MPRRRSLPPVAARRVAPGAAPAAAPVAEVKSSLRTNVTSAWQRAVGKMKSTKRKSREAPVEWTLDASPAELTLEVIRPVEAEGEDTADESGGAPSVSGVYAFRRADEVNADGAALTRSRERILPAGLTGLAVRRDVTLVVYGWASVEPGTLSWVFPNVASALAAARAMKNAVLWAILDGVRDPSPDDPFDVTAPCYAGAILVEGSG